MFHRRAFKTQVLLIFVILCMCRQEASHLSSKTVDDKDLKVKVDGWCMDSLRVRIGPAIDTEPVIQGLKYPPDCKVTSHRHMTRSNNTTTIQNGEVGIDIKADGSIYITRLDDNKVMLQSSSIHMDMLDGAHDINGHQLYTTTIAFQRRSNGDFITGLGEHKNEKLNYAGGNYVLHFENSQILATNYANGDISIPVYQSSDGYMFLWNSPSYGYMSINDTHIVWHSNSTNYIDFWISVSPSSAVNPPYKSLMSNYIAATGVPSNLPHWATGFIQCRLRYRTQQEVLDAAHEYVNRSIPISMIVIDYYHWRKFGDWSFNPDCFPDPKSMVQELDKLGIKVMVSVWPVVEANSAHFDTMLANDLVINNSTEKPWLDAMHTSTGSSAYLYDAFKPEARDALFKALTTGYIDYGIDTFWLDAAEPEGAIPGRMYFGAGQDMQVGMAYPREHQRGIYEGLRSRGNQAPISLARSTWIGGSSLGGAVWSGDIQSDFNTLSQQIRVAQDMAMSGVYLWTTDIGGFFNGKNSDPVMQELIVRWFQFGAFCPLFRLHGDRVEGQSTNQCGESGGPNEVWTYGEKAYKIIVEIIRLRESLRSEIQSSWTVAQTTGQPLLRPMLYDFLDEDCYKADDQFLFTDYWLVAPVYQYQARSRDVYLPKLHNSLVWRYYYDKTQVFSGGQWLRNFPAPLEEFPLFFKSSVKDDIMVEVKSS